MRRNCALPRSQKIQVRVGFFNIFNQAFANTNIARNDLDLTLESVCNVGVNGVPNGVGGTVDNICDPTAGFTFSENTRNTFGKINLLRGRRIIEFALKYYF